MLRLRPITVSLTSRDLIEFEARIHRRRRRLCSEDIGQEHRWLTNGCGLRLVRIKNHGNNHDNSNSTNNRYSSDQEYSLAGADTSREQDYSTFDDVTGYASSGNASLNNALRDAARPNITGPTPSQGISAVDEAIPQPAAGVFHTTETQSAGSFDDITSSEESQEEYEGSSFESFPSMWPDGFETNPPDTTSFLSGQALPSSLPAPFSHTPRARSNTYADEHGDEAPSLRPQRPAMSAWVSSSDPRSQVRVSLRPGKRQCFYQP